MGEDKYCRIRVDILNMIRVDYRHSRAHRIGFAGDHLSFFGQLVDLDKNACPTKRCVLSARESREWERISITVSALIFSR